MAVSDIAPHFLSINHIIHIAYITISSIEFVPRYEKEQIFIFVAQY